MNWNDWQRSWDQQQQAYMPDREQRFGVLLDVVEAVCGRGPRVLDLACGTGSITMRLLARLPDATSVALDLDPALLRIAAGSFDADSRVGIVRADLARSDWRRVIGDAPFDAVLTATALHWLPEPRLAELYTEVAGVLRPGGVFCNADHMPDPGLPALTTRVRELDDARRAAVYAGGQALSWQAWWDAARVEPALADAVADRDATFGGASSDHDGSTLAYSTHLDFLRSAGFGEVGLVWRGLGDAAFAAIR